MFHRSVSMLIRGASAATLAALAACCLGTAQGCTTASAETAPRGTQPSSSSATAHGTESRDPSITTASTSAPSSAPSAPLARSTPLDDTSARRVHYDLAAHVDHAELYRGDALIMDFGEPGDAKHTLGGWGTRVLRGAEIDGASTAFVRGSYGDVLLPIHGAGPLAIEARVRAPRDGDVTVYLDEQVALRTKADPSQFSVIRVDVPAGKLARGEHMLRLRASGMGRIGAHETALALDWVAVSPQGVGELTPPRTAALRKDAALSIPAGYTLAYALEVPAGSRLVGQLAQGKLRVRGVGDDLAVRELAEVGAGDKLDLDLAALSGKVTRLELVASADVVLSAPRVTVPQTRAPAALAKPVRNVLIYLVDTLRADHLKPFNGTTRVRTPGLDALVEGGSAVFTAAHTQENWTKPSVATLLSSLFPWEHHAVTTEAVVPNDVSLLPEILGARGFYTGAFIANGYVSDKFGFKQGFHTWRNYIREGRYSRAEFLAADAIEWLDKRPQDRPFFLYVHAIDPHVPYKPTAEFLKVYDPEPYAGVVNFNGDSELLEKIKIGRIKLNPRDKVHLEALYDSEISYHDIHFRSLLTALDKRGLADETMIVVVADHGEEFWDHGSVGHGHSVYEELLHIPMVMRVPSLTTEPMRITSTSGLVDVLPTVLEALGQDIPKDVSGRSLLPELRGDSLDAPRVTVSGFMDGWRTAVIGGLKLIQRTEKRVTLHDLATDPHEQTDVAAARPITTRYVRGQLGLALASSEQAGTSSSAKKAHQGQTTTIDPATEAQLRALGYVGSSRR